MTFQPILIYALFDLKYILAHPKFQQKTPKIAFTMLRSFSIFLSDMTVCGAQSSVCGWVLEFHGKGDVPITGLCMNFSSMGFQNLSCDGKT